MANVKKVTLNSFEKFCWTSPLIDDEFGAIVAKFFECASAELCDDGGLILMEDDGRFRWAWQEEIDRFLDYVSSQYLSIDEVKLEEQPMDHAKFTEECGSIVLQIGGYIMAQDRDSEVYRDLHNELLASFVREQILRVKPYFDYLESKRKERMIENYDVRRGTSQVEENSN